MQAQWFTHERLQSNIQETRAQTDDWKASIGRQRRDRRRQRRRRRGVCRLSPVWWGAQRGKQHKQIKETASGGNTSVINEWCKHNHFKWNKNVNRPYINSHGSSKRLSSDIFIFPGTHSFFDRRMFSPTCQTWTRAAKPLSFELNVLNDNNFFFGWKPGKRLLLGTVTV